jgi:kynureninase
MKFSYNKAFAAQLDQADKLSKFRNDFHIPSLNGKETIYYTGNSLGLQPKSVQSYLNQELLDWQQHGVEGHFHAKRPWFGYHHHFKQSLAKLVGAKTHEVVAMNNLSVNLHLLLVSFYKPKGNRTKILMEAGAFPSDMYVIESQVKFHGLNYETDVIELKPREGEYHLRTEDIVAEINQNKDTLALVFFSGVQYYTGQFFDMEAITKSAHAHGIIAGFDLAHAAGNRPLNLHSWGVDFAAWCSYKYLNSGPGGVSGVFIHEKHGLNPETPRFAGWWGHNEKERFLMEKGFNPEPGADGWQLSNAPVFSMAPHLASLEIFDQANIYDLAEKSDQLTAYLNFCIDEAIKQNPDLNIKIITPPMPHRAAQLSMLAGVNGKKLFDFLTKNGVIADWREPEVIRIAPVPLYNTFSEAFEFAEILSRFKA